MTTLIYCILLIAAGTGAGIAVSRRYAARVRQLEKCGRFLENLRAYLGFERLTTRELFERVCQSGSMDELTFLAATARAMETDPNFPLIWKECLRGSRGKLALTPDDYVPLTTLGELLGAYDAATQQEGIESVRELLRGNLEQAREQSRTMGKLSRSLGILGGIAAAILII